MLERSLHKRVAGEITAASGGVGRIAVADSGIVTNWSVDFASADWGGDEAFGAGLIGDPVLFDLVAGPGGVLRGRNVRPS